jgi:hypothetical protein
MKNLEKSKWGIVRVRDGTRICDLYDVSLIEEEISMHDNNVHRKAVCLVDNKTFKCYDINIDTLLHLGKIGKYFGENDIIQKSS